MNGLIDFSFPCNILIGIGVTKISKSKDSV